MEDAYDDDQEHEIVIRRPFQTKFMGQLNYMQNEKNKKNKRKMRQERKMNPKKRQKFDKIGMSPNQRTYKRLPQTNRNGNKIFGNWRNNQLIGQAEVIYSNGVIFKGTYQNGIKIKGHFQFLHGYEYIGNCLGNKFNGEGTLFFPSGKMITGQWKDYSIVDKGKIQYPNGEVYYGEIKNLKKHGNGYLFFQDNSKYVGEFQDGQIMGQGQYFINDQLVAQGNWIDGELQESIDLSKIQSDDEGSKRDLLKKTGKKSMKNISNNRVGYRGEGKGGKVEKKLRFADTTAHTFAQMGKSIPQL